MQISLNTLHEYCEEWMFKINVMKTMIMIIIFPWKNKNIS